MSLTDIILSFKDEKLPLIAPLEVELYIKDKTPEEIQKELLSGECQSMDLMGEIIREQNLEFLIFKAATGYEAQEEITRNGSNNKKGYFSFVKLVNLLTGKKNTVAETGKYFRNLAKENDMQILTNVSRLYVENFNVEYVRSTPADSLREITPIFSKPVKRPQNYAPFLKELHKKVIEDKILQYELLKKWIDIETDDQITYAGTKDIPGYCQLKSLCAFFTGRVMTEKETGRYFKWLVRTKGGTFKTRNLTDIIMGFAEHISPHYAVKAVREYTSTLIPELVCRELPLHLTKEREELSKKIRKLKLEFIIFKAATGYEGVEDIKLMGSANKLGYNSYTALAHLLSGKKKSIPKTGRYFKDLAKKYKMP